MNILLTSDAGIIGINLAAYRLARSGEPVILTYKPKATLVKSAVHASTWLVLNEVDGSPRTVDLSPRIIRHGQVLTPFGLSLSKPGISPDSLSPHATSCPL